MSTKIDITSIVKGHFGTLKNYNTGKVYIPDIITFYIIPLIISLFLIVIRLDLTKDLVNIVVTIGSIFTALLLNLLILVYDQKTKLPKVDSNSSDWEIIQLKHRILKETYYNISYSTVLSLFIVVFSILQLILIDFSLNIPYVDIENIDISMCITTPIIVFFGIHLVLTLFMIIKRIFRLLITET